LAGIGCGAYLLSFLRNVLLTSTRGERQPPPWPELDIDSLREVVIESIALGIVCFGPATLWRVFQPSDSTAGKLVGEALFAFGGIYGAMAVLAVVIYDNIAALNPLLVFLSILRVPLRYFGFCLFMGALLLLVRGVESTLLNADSPRLALLAGSACSTYAVLAVLRALGWFYRSSENELDWH
jgi:hypothetical protein